MSERDRYPHGPGHKGPEGETSYRAARSVAPRAWSQKERVVIDLTQNGPSTAYEIAARAGFRNHYIANSRIAELKVEGHVVATGQTRSNLSGADADVVRLTTDEEFMEMAERMRDIIAASGRAASGARAQTSRLCSVGSSNG
jgi:hypothetical protein